MVQRQHDERAVGGTGRERDALGGRSDHAHPRVRYTLGAHDRGGLDGDHVMAPFGQGAGVLAGAGANIQQSGVRRQGYCRAERLHDAPVGRPALGVTHADGVIERHDSGLVVHHDSSLTWFMLRLKRQLSIPYIASVLWCGLLVAAPDDHGRDMADGPTPTGGAGIQDIRFRGWYEINQVAMIALSAGEQTAVTWVSVGGNFMDYQVRSIGDDRDLVTLVDRSGELHEIAIDEVRFGGKAPPGVMRLPGVRAASTSEEEDHTTYPPKGTPRSEEGLNWEWIYSEANPMPTLRDTVGTLDRESWQAMSDAERADVVELFRQCGYHLTVMVPKTGRGFGREVAEIKPPPDYASRPRPASPPRSLPKP
jgi:hypothetical protein